MKTLIVCVNQRANPNQPSCGARGGIEIADYAEAAVSRSHPNIRIERFKCLGVCDSGPTLKIIPDGNFVHGIKLADMPALISEIAAASDQE